LTKPKYQRAKSPVRQVLIKSPASSANRSRSKGSNSKAELKKDIKWFEKASGYFSANHQSKQRKCSEFSVQSDKVSELLTAEKFMNQEQAV
jgi:hypothetical protein